MRTNFFFMLLLLAVVKLSAQVYDIPVTEVNEHMQTGIYQPNWESLKTHQPPEWFRDAKFGIWAHWGPQCVEGTGDWMARSMYIEGSPEYKWHVEHYGHPSEVGFKDIIPLLTSENWNPDALVEKYKRCGAQYFFVLGNHHDNFDMWDSKYQPWNAMNMGPKRDVLKEWAAAARKAGLPFGISFHADHAWTFYEAAQRYDMDGPKAGVYYDGHLTAADGKGKWWEGLDPQQLYVQRHPMSEKSWATNILSEQWEWQGGANLPTQDFINNFYDRTIDAINRYEPDLVYFDATVLPFDGLSDCGLRLTAHMYNRNPKAVVFGKLLDKEQRKALTWDVERGAPNEKVDEPWQTCSCLGGWSYNTSFYDNNGYKRADVVVKLLVDVVSKNGNLLLSVPLRADGTYDDKEAAILDELEAWMAVNRESIFGTRPWLIFGEGPEAEKVNTGERLSFNDVFAWHVDARDIRFTQSKRYLYVTPLGWPQDGKVLVKSLAKGNNYLKRNINSVYLLGYGKLAAQQTHEGLLVQLPPAFNKIAPVLRINL